MFRTGCALPCGCRISSISSKWRQVDAELCGLRERLALVRVDDELNLLELEVDATRSTRGGSPCLSDLINERTVRIGHNHATSADIGPSDDFVVGEHAANLGDAGIGNLYGGVGRRELRT